MTDFKFMCCEKQNIQNMDYLLNDGFCMNRVCLTCGTHWHGRMKKYFRREWDKFLEEDAKNDEPNLRSA